MQRSYESVAKAFGGRGAINVSEASNQGGVNLFKWGEAQTSKIGGWKEGDCMLSLPDLGNPKANWQQNSGWLREVMKERRVIYDSYRDPVTGFQIKTTGFLKAERNLLESHGWKYTPETGGYYPPAL